MCTCTISSRESPETLACIDVYWISLPTLLSLRPIESLVETNTLHLRLTPEDLADIYACRTPQLSYLALASRLLQRDLIAHKLQVDPLKVIILRPRGYKPRTLEPVNFQWNVSHDGNFVVLADLLTSYGSLGVDIMELRIRKRHQDAMHLLSNLKYQLTTHEWQWIISSTTHIKKCHGTPHEFTQDDALLMNFFVIWTAKEAYLKACGSGITYSLNRLAVSPHKNPKCPTTPCFISANPTLTPSFVNILLPQMTLEKDGQPIKCRLAHWLYQWDRKSIPVVCCICLLEYDVEQQVSIRHNSFPFNALVANKYWMKDAEEK